MVIKRFTGMLSSKSGGGSSNGLLSRIGGKSSSSESRDQAEDITVPENDTPEGNIGRGVVCFYAPAMFTGLDVVDWEC